MQPLESPQDFKADAVHGGFKIDDFKQLVTLVKEAGKTEKRKLIEQLFKLPGLTICHIDKGTSKIIVSDCDIFEYPHEYQTAKKLAENKYDVLFVPKGYFNRWEKRFDIFLIHNHVFLEADLKCIRSQNPDTIGKRIRQGSDQSSRLVLDICSGINKPGLIEGLKSGCSKNNFLLEIFLFYNSGFYVLPRTQILSRKIFNVIK